MVIIVKIPSMNFTITEFDDAYKYCSQDIKSFSGLSFPALPQWQPEGGEWMTDEQEEIVSLHGWSSLVVLVVIAASIVMTMMHDCCCFGTVDWSSPHLAETLPGLAGSTVMRM